MKFDPRAFLGEQVAAAEAVAALPTALRNLWGTFTGHGGGDSPAFVTWALTTDCQCHCKHCLMQPEPVAPPGVRMQIARAIAKSGAWGVSLIGGEPLVVPGVVDYLSLIGSAGKRVSIGTNGLLLADFARDLVAAGVDAIYVSIDSHRPTVHDSIRNTPGLLDSIARGLAALEAAAHRLDVRKPRVVARCTLSRANVAELEACLDHWSPRVDGFLVQPIQDATIHDVRDQSLLFRPSDEPLVRAALASASRRYPFLRNPYFRYLPDYVFHRDRLFDRLHYECLAQTAMSLTVLPDGRAMVCYGRKDSHVGTLPGHSVRDIWTSETTRRTRARLRFDCKQCFCWESHKLFDLYLLKALGPARGILEHVRG